MSDVLQKLKAARERVWGEHPHVHRIEISDAIDAATKCIQAADAMCDHKSFYCLVYTTYEKARGLTQKAKQ